MPAVGVDVQPHVGGPADRGRHQEAVPGVGLQAGARQHAEPGRPVVQRRTPRRRCPVSLASPGALPLKWLVSSSASRTTPGSAQPHQHPVVAVVAAAGGLPALAHRPGQAGQSRLFGRP